MKNKLAIDLIKAGFAGTVSDVRVVEESLAIRAIEKVEEFYEYEVERYKQALEESIEREKIARQIVDEKRRKYE